MDSLLVCCAPFQPFINPPYGGGMQQSDEPSASSDDEDIGVVPELSSKAYQKATE